MQKFRNNFRRYSRNSFIFASHKKSRKVLIRGLNKFEESSDFNLNFDVSWLEKETLTHKNNGEFVLRSQNMVSLEGIKKLVNLE